MHTLTTYLDDLLQRAKDEQARALAAYRAAVRDEEQVRALQDEFLRRVYRIPDEAVTPDRQERAE